MVFVLRTHIALVLSQLPFRKRHISFESTSYVDLEQLTCFCEMFVSSFFFFFCLFFIISFSFLFANKSKRLAADAFLIVFIVHVSSVCFGAFLCSSVPCMTLEFMYSITILPVLLLLFLFSKLFLLVCLHQLMTNFAKLLSGVIVVACMHVCVRVFVVAVFMALSMLSLNY